MGRGGHIRGVRGAVLALGIHNYSPPPVFPFEHHSFPFLPEFAPVIFPPHLYLNIFSFKKSFPIFIFKEGNSLHLIFCFCLEWSAIIAFTCSASFFFFWNSIPISLDEHPLPSLLGHKIRVMLTTTILRGDHMTFVWPISVSDSD